MYLEQTLSSLHRVIYVYIKILVDQIYILAEL